MIKDIEQARTRLAVLEAQFSAAGGRGVELAEEIDSLRRDIALHGRQFYRTVIEIEVLTDEPFDPGSLGEVEYEITQGHASGDWKVSAVELVDAARMAELLEAQGSDPSFLLGEPGDWSEDVVGEIHLPGTAANTPSGDFTLHDLVQHADGSDGQVVSFHPTDATIVLIQWDDEAEADWTPTDMIERR